MNEKGQFIILAAISLITAILVIAAIATNSGIRIRSSQEFFMPIPIINAVNDGGRILTVALARASWIYNETGLNFEVANNTAYSSLLGWINNFTEAHGGRGVSVYIMADLDFNWNGTASWWSNSTGLLIIYAPSIGFPELRLNLAIGIILSNLNVVDGVGFNVTAIDVHRNVGVPIKLVSLKVDGTPIITWDYRYFGLGVNGYYFSSINPVSKIEAYFEFQGILVRLYWEG